MEKGLYKKLSSTELSYAANSIHYPNGQIITVSEYENHEGEVYDGWYWFNSKEEALIALNITEQETLANTLNM